MLAAVHNAPLRSFLCAQRADVHAGWHTSTHRRDDDAGLVGFARDRLLVWSVRPASSVATLAGRRADGSSACLMPPTSSLVPVCVCGHALFRGAIRYAKQQFDFNSDDLGKQRALIYAVGVLSNTLLLKLLRAGVRPVCGDHRAAALCTARAEHRRESHGSSGTRLAWFDHRCFCLRRPFPAFLDVSLVHIACPPMLRPFAGAATAACSSSPSRFESRAMR